jgi:pyruvate dehydrogenase E2 component (dihydrolipoamide acetyltransferase)
MPENPSIGPAIPRGRTERLSRLRRTIARRMVESLQVSAQLTSVVEVDYTSVADARRQANRERDGSQARLSYLPFIAKAALDALPRHPSVNATVDTDRGEATYFDSRHLAIAVDTPRGLVAPVIADAGNLSVGGLAEQIAIIAERARAGRLMPDELAGGTFTITNTGSRGALFDTPIVNQPQVAILGTGAIIERPVARRDGAGEARIDVAMMGYLALSYDHRLVDGADAARFLGDVKATLEAGEWALSMVGSR